MEPIISICREIKYRNIKRVSGIAALPVVLLISGIIIFIVAAGAFLAFSFSRGNFGTLLSAKALSGARAGSDDAIYRIIKDNYLNLIPYCLSLTGTHSVVVENIIERDPVDLGACTAIWGCRYRIRSRGRALFRERRVETILSVDPRTREIRRESFREIEIDPQAHFSC